MQLVVELDWARVEWVVSQVRLWERKREMGSGAGVEAFGCQLHRFAIGDGWARGEQGSGCRCCWRKTRDGAIQGGMKQNCGLKTAPLMTQLHSFSVGSSRGQVTAFVFFFSTDKSGHLLLKFLCLFQAFEERKRIEQSWQVSQLITVSVASSACFLPAY
jgi:hypothetical protein